MTMTQTEIRTTVSQNVRDRRLLLNMTQVELAQKCGVDQATISAIESGKSGVNDKMLSKLTVALHCHPKDLYSEAAKSARSRNFKMVS